ncbi:MAG: hypothetical protein ABEJ68_00125 [Halobacteriaceae archaeon]
MAPEEPAASIEGAETELRSAWQESGDTGDVSCPSCGATEYEWDVEDEQVRMRCEHCGYADTKRYA